MLKVDPWEDQYVEHLRRVVAAAYAEGAALAGARRANRVVLEDAVSDVWEWMMGDRPTASIMNEVVGPIAPG